jgi:hypothetical protein
MQAEGQISSSYTDERGDMKPKFRSNRVAPRQAVLLQVVLCVLVGMMLACSSTALAARAHLPGGTFGEPCTTEPCGNGQLKEPEGVAVNETTGDIYVADKGDNRVEYFTASGAYLGQFNGSGLLPGEGTGAPTGQISAPSTVKIDNACQLHKPVLTETTTPTCHEFDPSNGDVYVLDVGNHLVDKFTATGEYLNQIKAHNLNVNFPFILGVYVDQNGHLWTCQYGESFLGEVDDYTDEEVNEFISSRVIPGTPDENEPGFVVDPKSGFYYFYKSEFSAPPERLTSFGSGLLLAPNTTQPIRESIGSEVSTGLADEPTSHDVYVDTGSRVTRYSAALAPLERLGSGTLAKGSGVSVDDTTETLYIADSAADDIKIFLPRPPGVPTIVDHSISSVTGESATGEAAIDPEGSGTSYRIEYGTTAAYGQSAPSPEGEVGSDYEAHEVDVPVQGLLSHTVYHYRIVATNAFGTVYGEDETFMTQTTGVASALIDERSWELASPPHKNGADFFGAGDLVQAAADGDAFVDLASQPTEDGAEGFSGYVDVLMTRGSEGWSSQTIAPAHAQGTGQTNGSEYRFFSEDLSRGLLQPYGSFTALSPEASESTPYLRTDYVGGDVNDHCLSGCYQPLVTRSDTAPGVQFGDATEAGCPTVFCGPEFLAATPDLSHVLLASTVQLTSERAPGGGVYEWSNGTLRLVSSERQVAGGRSTATVAEAFEQRFGMHAISADGQRVILGGGGKEGIYLHEMSSGTNIRLDEPEGGPGPSVYPQFVGASDDASKIFFIDGGHLTAAGSSSGADLYEYDTDRAAGEKLADLSVDTNPGEAANVQTVFGESQDGSYVYFVAAGALAPGASPGVCGNSEEELHGAQSNSCNIYVRHDGVTSFVAGEWHNDAAGDIYEAKLTRVSPDGRWLSFMSSSGLTGYDTRDARTGQPDEEVYLYSAIAKSLVCASCDPTGARPVGEQPAGVASSQAALQAANVPLWASYGEGGVLPYQPRYLVDGGRLFFNSYDALVPQDVDGTEDVYEFEPSGTGRCAAAVSSYVEARGGCLGLISSGTSPEESAFVDASETGGDVFFRTSARLVSQDFDNAADIYDARECSDATPCLPVASVSPASCATGDSCKPAPTPQPGLFGPPPSATFSGAGNVSAAVPVRGVKSKSLTRTQKLSRALKACHLKRSRGRRRSCEAAARKRYGLKKGKANSKKKGGR